MGHTVRQRAMYQGVRGSHTIRENESVSLKVRDLEINQKLPLSDQESLEILGWETSPVFCGSEGIF